MDNMNNETVKKILKEAFDAGVAWNKGGNPGAIPPDFEEWYIKNFEPSKLRNQDAAEKLINKNKPPSND